MELSKSSRESDGAAADTANGEEQPLLGRDPDNRQSSSSSHAPQGQNLPHASDKSRPGLRVPASAEVRDAIADHSLYEEELVCVCIPHPEECGRPVGRRYMSMCCK